MLLDDTDGLCHRLLISCDSDAAAGFPSTSCIHLSSRNGHTAIVRLVVYELCELSECRHCVVSLVSDGMTRYPTQ